MTLSHVQRGIALCLFFLAAVCVRSQGLLITCANPQTCQFKEVAALSVNGRPAVRGVAAKSVEAVSLPALRASKDTKIDDLPGLVRDPASGQVWVFSPGAESREMIFPSGFNPKDQGGIAGLWNSAKLGYRDSLKAKAENPVAVQTFAAYLTGRDPKDVAVTYARTLIAGSSPLAWKAGLLAGAVQFAASAPSYKAWQNQLFAASRDALTSYRKQEGDPRQLGELLSTAIADGQILAQIAPSDPSYAALLKDARTELEVLKRKVAIADAFIAGGYWDEAVLKIHEIGTAKWSFAELSAGERNALVNSAKAHKTSAEKLAGSGLFDRAFDEAELAYRRDPCSVEISFYFDSIRPQFVEQNRDPRQGETTTASRPQLQQLERQLRSFDAVQLQQQTYRDLGYSLIAQGDALDRTYVPFQLAKAQFLRNVGKLSEALDVAIEVERHYGLDARQRSDWLDLDANLSLTLSAMRKKSVDDSTSNYDAGRFTQAVDAATAGLTADPIYPALLLERAQASASLRQPDEALRSIQTLLQSGNAACTDPQQYEKAFALRDALAGPTPATAASQPSEPADGVANWMSGRKYATGKLYYDPISLSLVPRVVVVSGQKPPNAATSFTWDGLRLVNIETKVNTVPAGRQGSKPDSGQTTFFVDVEYAPGTLRMTAVAPRTIQEGKRVAYALTFWNDPRVNVALLQNTGKSAARGWAGNPVFDPFIWSGVYLFDFKYDDKGRVVEATPVPDETRGRSFSETLNFSWDNSNRLMSVSSKSYRRTLKYDNKGRLVSEVAAFRNIRAETNYEYTGNSIIPRSATSSSVFDQQRRSIFFQAGN